MKIHAARLRLGMKRSDALTADAVKAAFAAKIKADHPDHGGTGTASKSLKRDRDFLLRQCEERETCPHCGGKGYV